MLEKLPGIPIRNFVPGVHLSAREYNHAFEEISTYHMIAMLGISDVMSQIRVVGSKGILRDVNRISFKKLRKYCYAFDNKNGIKIAEEYFQDINHHALLLDMFPTEFIELADIVTKSKSDKFFLRHVLSFGSELSDIDIIIPGVYQKFDFVISETGTKIDFHLGYTQGGGRK